MKKLAAAAGKLLVSWPSCGKNNSHIYYFGQAGGINILNPSLWRSPRKKSEQRTWSPKYGVRVTFHHNSHYHANDDIWNQWAKKIPLQKTMGGSLLDWDHELKEKCVTGVATGWSLRCHVRFRKKLSEACEQPWTLTTIHQFHCTRLYCSSSFQYLHWNVTFLLRLSGEECHCGWECALENVFPNLSMQVQLLKYSQTKLIGGAHLTWKI